MIAITGASGQTGSKLAELLLRQGEKIRVFGRSAEKLHRFASRGAEIKVGDQEDQSFLTDAFRGVDSLYAMIPPKFNAEDVLVHYKEMGEALVRAISGSGIHRIVFLSSFGADLDKGTGPVLGLHNVELMLGELKDIDIAFLRPASFMENQLGNIPLIKNKKIIGSVAAPDTFVHLIASKDISSKAAELLMRGVFKGPQIFELFGDRLPWSRITAMIGEAIGVPSLPYIKFSDEDYIKGFMSMGASQNIAASFAEMIHTIESGKVFPHAIDPEKPNTPTRFAEFVKDVFVPAYKNG